MDSRGSLHQRKAEGGEFSPVQVPLQAQPLERETRNPEAHFFLKGVTCCGLSAEQGKQ